LRNYYGICMPLEDWVIQFGISIHAERWQGYRLQRDGKDKDYYQTGRVGSLIQISSWKSSRTTFIASILLGEVGVDWWDAWITWRMEFFNSKNQFFNSESKKNQLKYVKQSPIRGQGVACPCVKLWGFRQKSFVVQCIIRTCTASSLAVPQISRRPHAATFIVI
jgi:hypothetical protein